MGASERKELVNLCVPSPHDQWIKIKNMSHARDNAIATSMSDTGGEWGVWNVCSQRLLALIFSVVMMRLYTTTTKREKIDLSSAVIWSRSACLRCTWGIRLVRLACWGCRACQAPVALLHRCLSKFAIMNCLFLVRAEQPKTMRPKYGMLVVRLRINLLSIYC